MKKAGLMTGMLLMLLIAGSTSLKAQRVMREGMDSTRMIRHGRNMDFRHMRGMESWRNNMRGPIPGRRYGMNPDERFGMRGPGQFPGYQMGMRPYKPGRNMIEAIPNLTDTQKNEIAVLRKQQQNEMKKLREDFSGKMQTLREDHRKKLMSLLTDEQKKALEQPSERTNQVTPKAK